MVSMEFRRERGCFRRLGSKRRKLAVVSGRCAAALVTETRLDVKQLRRAQTATEKDDAQMEKRTTDRGGSTKKMTGGGGDEVSSGQAARRMGNPVKQAQRRELPRERRK